jgi:alpha-L-arabinofuranosidase
VESAHGFRHEAHNTFEQPDTVRPATGDARVSGGGVAHTMPPKSVTKIELTIA